MLLARPYAVVAALMAGLLTLTEAGPARARTAVCGFALPTRRGDGAALAERARRVAARLGDSAAAAAADSAVAARLRLAQDLYAQGRLDEAAALMDSALETGARDPHRFADPALFVTAHLTRSAIAPARVGKSVAARVSMAANSAGMSSLGSGVISASSTASTSAPT